MKIPEECVCSRNIKQTVALLIWNRGSEYVLHEGEKIVIHARRDPQIILNAGHLRVYLHIFIKRSHNCHYCGCSTVAVILPLGWWGWSPGLGNSSLLPSPLHWRSYAIERRAAFAWGENRSIGCITAYNTYAVQTVATGITLAEVEQVGRADCLWLQMFDLDMKPVFPQLSLQVLVLPVVGCTSGANHTCIVIPQL